MRDELGDRLPRFSAEEQGMLKGSVDMFGLNTYAGRLVAEATPDRSLDGPHF
jgi:hypothetical protein